MLNINNCVFRNTSNIGSLAVKQGVVDGLKSIGKAGENVVKKNNVKYVIAEKCSDVLPQYKGVKPQSWETGTFDDVPASCLKNIVFIYTKNLGKTSDLQSLVRHETAHAVSNSFINTTGKLISQSVGFRKAYQQDIVDMRENIKKVQVPKKCLFHLKGLVHDSTVDKVSDVGAEETWAELYAKALGGSVQNSYHEGFDNITNVLFSKTTAFVNAFLKIFGDK